MSRNSRSASPVRGPMDAFVRQMTAEELAAQRERQTEENRIYCRTTLHQHRVTSMEKQRAAARDRKRVQRAKQRENDILTGIRDADGRIIKLDCPKPSTKVPRVLYFELALKCDADSQTPLL